jgi:hypothetical protein
MARLQKTSVPADPRGVDRSLALLESDLDGEIDVRRAFSGDRGGSVAQLTLPKRLREPDGGPLAHPVHVDDFDRIEDYLRAYLEDERFRSVHPLACGRWVVAWEMLWCADSRAKVIAVGHRSRDAMQAFASSLVEQSIPPALDPGWPEVLTDGPRRADPLEGLLTILDACRHELGEERHALLCELAGGWRALLEAVQCHEHRPQAGDVRLRWEDGRRLVLFTALVMVETDRSLG